MRCCIDCARPIPKGTRCPEHEKANRERRKAEGLTGERGSTHASRLRRYRTLERANHLCFYCGAPADREDHYIPLAAGVAAGGVDDETNTVAACQPCNSAKSDQMPKVFMESEWLVQRRAEVRQAREKNG